MSIKISTKFKGSMVKKIIFAVVALAVSLNFAFASAEDDFNKGVEAYKRQDFKTAAELFKKACNGGVADGCRLLGGFYYDGLGVRQDYKKASELYEKACNGGDVSGCGLLGSLYADGKGVRQNKKTAKEYFGKACDLGLQSGCDAYKKLNEAGY